MRNIFLTIVLAFIISAMYGQTENLTYKAIADKFEANYNTGKYDSIFAMF